MKLTCDTIESNYHTIPKTTYESFVSKNYISYLITYKFNNNEITKSYVYDVNTKKRVYFNNNLITKINITSIVMIQALSMLLLTTMKL